MRLIKGNVERVAESQEQIAMLKRDGFQPLDGNAQEGSANHQRPLTDMGVAELRALAETAGIEGSASLTKKELLEVLKDVV